MTHIHTSPGVLAPGDDRSVAKRNGPGGNAPPAAERPDRRENLVSYLFMSPWIAGFLFLIAGPMVFSLYLSFTEYNLFEAPRWIGLQNFTDMFADPRWRQSVKVTSWYVLIGTPVKLAAALAVAMLLAQKRWGQSFYRAAFYAPSLIGASVSAAIVWRALFSDDALVDRTQKVFGVEAAWAGSATPR